MERFGIIFGMKAKTLLPLQAGDINQYEHIEAIEHLLEEMRVHLYYVGKVNKSDKCDDAIKKMDECIHAVLQCSDYDTGRIRLDVPDFVKFARKEIKLERKIFGESIKASEAHGNKPVASVSFDINSGKTTITDNTTPDKVIRRKRITLSGLWEKFCQLR